MHGKHKIVACVPAGRERYLKVLVPYLLKRGQIVDRFDFWVNTDVQADIDYIEQLPRLDPRIKLVYSDGVIRGVNERAKQVQYNDSVNKFYRNCLDADTIYFKVDDDICYIHDRFFENMVEARTSDPSAFLVFANMLNCPMTSKIYQDKGIVDHSAGTCNGYNRCSVGFFSGKFAVHLHDTFLALARQNKLNGFVFDTFSLSAQQLRIGCMCWFGSDFATFGGVIPPDAGGDEGYLSNGYPASLKRGHAYCGDGFACHFAFAWQRNELEQTDLLERYFKLMSEVCK